MAAPDKLKDQGILEIEQASGPWQKMLKRSLLMK